MRLCVKKRHIFLIACIGLSLIATGLSLQEPKTTKTATAPTGTVKPIIADAVFITKYRPTTTITTTTLAPSTTTTHTHPPTTKRSTTSSAPRSTTLPVASPAPPAYNEDVLYNIYCGAGEVRRAISESLVEFGMQHEAKRICRIAGCESTFNANANNGSHGGIFQQSFEYWPGRVKTFNAANSHYPVGSNVFSPFDNARVSIRMMKAGQWDDWSCK